MTEFTTRSFLPAVADRLAAQGLPPVLARIFAARGIESAAELEPELARLLPLSLLRHADDAARLLADAIGAGKRLLIVGDYDADGATACAIGVRALRAFGASVDYLVPNRFEYGYGLSPEIVRVAVLRQPDLLITVDNGIASVAGVAEATRLGIEVLVTDHHLAGERLPDARCIVNPNQPGCAFPSKHLAGVGVMFYVLLALRAELRARGAFAQRPQPNLAALLDIVALGTVADVVKLDANNRILVEQGLRRIRAGKLSAGIAALFRVSDRELARASSYDLGYFIAPRLNAAGRLQDMSLGIECLLTDDSERAFALAKTLDDVNQERRAIERDMRDTAFASLEAFQPRDNFSISLFNPDWHQGVVGLLAARVKEKFHRPAIAFARGGNGELKGSGRAIANFHLRDALDLVDKRNAGLIVRFGGHAAAAGLTIEEARFAAFAAAFEQVARATLSHGDLRRTIETDGALARTEACIDLARELQRYAWGCGFPLPIFYDRFRLVEQRQIGARHLRLKLVKLDSGAEKTQRSALFEAILFGRTELLPARIEAAYRLSISSFGGLDSLELIIDHWAPI